MLIAASGVILSARFDPPAYYPGLAFIFKSTEYTKRRAKSKEKGQLLAFSLQK